MTNQTPSYLEDRVSQIPALRLLMAMGWQYLTPNEVNALRQQKLSQVILVEVLLDWLRGSNQFQHKGKTHAFSEAGLIEAMRTILDVPLHKGLIPASEDVYELLTLGKSIEQTIDGDRRSYSLKYIDWEHPENNIYQVTDEFVVERRGTTQTRRPDIVLFVNGIPLAVIECKRPDQSTQEGKPAVYAGVSQMLRNQRLGDEIPHLFAYTQLLLAASVNAALYGTTATGMDFWGSWKEEHSAEFTVQSAESKTENRLRELINRPLEEVDKARLYGWRDDGHWLREYFDAQEAAGDRLATTQDRTLVALLDPRRLLELTYQFILYDGGIKKITRYQQYFAIKATVDRVANVGRDGKRAGGVIWHTTGSGKSLTMVMLAKALALHPAIQNPRVVIVTDRIDLDQQIWKTFHNCGKQVYQAGSGAELVELIRSPRAEIITTVIDKFETAARGLRDDNPNIFVLVDESHRGQYGSSHAKMKEVFPNGCYIGFTGTPLLKKDKTTAERFGGFIHKYTMRQAVADGAVVPLLYEGRIVDLDVSRDAIDTWFERRTRELTDDQKTDLKRKMSRFDEVGRTQPRMELIAYDIAQHYIKNWRGLGLKAQLATSSKEMAVRYLYALEDEGIECGCIMSAPDTREGSEDAEGSSLPLVQEFWKRMMALYKGSEDTYLREIKGSFAREDGIEILVVVDKLLVGFDEPRNTVLYIDKPLREHGLLQAIARVNRLFEGKEFGYIVDYRGVLGELNEALETYNALEGFDTEDVAGTITDMSAVVDTLPGLHDQLWAIFDPVQNKQDNEALERFLEPEDRRAHFYDALTAYARTLKMALSMVTFYETTPEKRINTYKRDLLFFHNLRNAVKLRYAEAVDYGEYEQKIRKLMNDHIKAEGVSIITPEVNIFNQAEFEAAVSELTTPASRADAIAYRLKKTATEEMEKDPAFYRKFSQMIEGTIEDYRQGRIDQLEYLNRVESARDELATGKDSSLPSQLANYHDASAYYGLLLEPLSRYADGDGFQDLVADIAIACEETINQLKVRDWAHNPDVINRIRGGLDDLLYGLKNDFGIALTSAEMDTIIDNVVETAKQRDRLL